MVSDNKPLDGDMVTFPVCIDLVLLGLVARRSGFAKGFGQNWMRGFGDGRGDGGRFVHPASRFWPSLSRPVVLDFRKDRI